MLQICITVCLLYHRNLNETREPGFWTDNVNEGWSKLTKITPKSTVFVQAAATQGYIRQLLVVIKEKETR